MSSWVRVATKRSAWRRRRWLCVCRRRHRCRCGEAILPPLTCAACLRGFTLGRFILGRLRCPRGGQGWRRRDGSRWWHRCRGAIDAGRPHRWCIWRDSRRSCSRRLGKSPQKSVRIAEVEASRLLLCVEEGDDCLGGNVVCCRLDHAPDTRGEDGGISTECAGVWEDGMTADGVVMGLGEIAFAVGAISVVRA